MNALIAQRVVDMHVFNIPHRLNENIVSIKRYPHRKHLFKK